MTPEQYVQQKAAASGSSFYYAFLFLPKERRAAITAFYAFCREVDDVVDEVTDPGVAHTKLAWWQSEVAKSFAGTHPHPVMKALMLPADAWQRHGVTEAQLLALDDTPNAITLIAACARSAWATMLKGSQLTKKVPGRAGWELRLVVQGGLRILDKIEAMNFNTLQQRPNSTAGMCW